MASASANRVRIIGGEWRSRVVRFTPRPGLRPTADRVRETVFNWLGQELSDLACLDLFAGSGALGFEAASRRARSVVLVESDRVAAAGLRENAALFGSAALRVVQSDALQFLRLDGGCYDVVFIDPPFDAPASLIGNTLKALQPRLGHHARVYVESPRAKACVPPPDWQTIKAATAGAVHYQLLERSDER